MKENFGFQRCLSVEKEEVNTGCSGLGKREHVCNFRASVPSSHNQHAYILPQKRCESVDQCVCHVLLFFHIDTHTHLLPIPLAGNVGHHSH